MKKLIFMVFAFMALSAPLQANMPVQLPKNAQEKLAWGLCNYDQKVVMQALKEGADPFACHTTQYARNTIKGYRTLAGSKVESLLEFENLCPYYLLFFTPKRAQLDIKDAHKAIVMTALALLKKGVPVDRIGYYTFRQQIDLGLAQFEALIKDAEDTIGKSDFILANQTKKETVHQMAKLMKDLLTLMKKYQKEPFDFEYASSIGSKK